MFLYFGPETTLLCWNFLFLQGICLYIWALPDGLITKQQRYDTIQKFVTCTMSVSWQNRRRQQSQVAHTTVA